MLEMWLATDASATWRDIIKAIDSPAIPQDVQVSAIPFSIPDDISGKWVFLFIFTNKLSYKLYKCVQTPKSATSSKP